MFASIMKNLSVAFCCIHMISILSGQKHILQKHYIPCGLSAIILCVETLLLKSSYPELSYLIPFLTLFSFTLLFYRFSIKDSLYYSLLSYGINLIAIESITLLLCASLSPLPFYSNRRFLDLLTLIITAVYLVLYHIISHSKRFQAGSSILQSKPIINIGCFICTTILVIVTLEQIYLPSVSFSYLRFIRITLVFLSAFLFILWWRTQITKSYRDKLRILEMENLRAEQLEKDRYIARLETDNERMGLLIHKDNRLLNAMADSVSLYLETMDSVLPREQKEKGLALSREIAAIRSDRQELLSQSTASINTFPSTGFVGVDALLAFLSKEAAQYHIDLKFHFQEAFFQRPSPCMEENDLVHLLSDLTANAITASRYAGGGAIEISLLVIKGVPTVSIADSGIPFEIATYMNFGLERASTHTDDGGSGIGLLDIWKCKNKYRLSLYIQEFSDNTPYQKRITFLFDRKNRYLISSPRYNEILSKQSRTDLMIVDPSKNSMF